ncbi:hypothetical protein [Streptomyces sp. NPDC015131]|uniref:hypothetical protein n=1 Tax=Streptomyces sp. NPDC015131 TaxID=3364941 RepID=UPI0037025130
MKYRAELKFFETEEAVSPIGQQRYIASVVIDGESRTFVADVVRLAADSFQEEGER